MTRVLACLLASAVLLATGAGAAQCAADSGARRVPLLELYTSEGCDSCPPADRWVSALAQRGLSAERVLTLGFHVDYWNYLGWNDPYARAEFSARQRAASRRNHARVVYTPQLLLNGKDYRRGAFRDSFADEIAVLNGSKPGARISIKATTVPPGTLSIEGTALVPDATARSNTGVYLALYENNLSSRVKAGENKGKHLRHDFVVRELAGPYPVDHNGTAPLHKRFTLDAPWKLEHLHIAAFVQNERTGDVLQAIALPYCRSPGGG